MATKISRNIEQKSQDYDPSTQGLMEMVRAAFERQEANEKKG